MKRTIQIIVLLLLSGNVFSQSFPYMKFRKPTYANSTYRFTHVVSGVDAMVTVLSTKNATISNIDDSSSHKYAWQPFISYGRTNGLFDTSYVEFKVTFVNNLSGSAVNQDNIAVTVVDLDGGITLRETVSASLPSTPRGILGSTISTLSGLLKNTFVSGIVSFSNIDTNNVAAMTQINYANVNNIVLRVGVIGRITSNTTRQSSFYFKGFNTMNFVLPVQLMNFDAYAQEFQNVIKWSTTTEENSNRFEVYRSFNGVDFTQVGTIAANGNTHSVHSYMFTDNNSESLNSACFYKLKMVDNDESSAWSPLVYVAKEAETTTVKSLFPNPSNGVLNVNFGTVSEDDFTVEIVDMYGKVYQSINGSDLNGSSNASFDVTDLNKGIYFVRISSETNSDLTKFVKI